MARMLTSDTFTHYVELSSHYEGECLWFAGQQVVAVLQDEQVGLHRLVDGRHVEDAEQFALTSAEMAALIEAYRAFLAQRETTDDRSRDAVDDLGDLNDHPF